MEDALEDAEAKQKPSKKFSPIRISPMKDPIDINEEGKNERAIDAEFPKESSNEEDGVGDGDSSTARKRKNKDSKKKTDIEQVCQHVMSLLTLE